MRTIILAILALVLIAELSSGITYAVTAHRASACPAEDSCAYDGRAHAWVPAAH